jgi:hypothetical protein
MPPLPPRLEALLRRDLGAADLRVIADVPEPAAGTTLTAALPRGRTLVVELADPGVDREALQRRLDVLVTSFRELLDDAAGEEAQKASVAERLHDELRELAGAAGAIDALVIDAQSEVVWGAAEADDAEPHVLRAPAEVIPLDPVARESAPPPPPRRPTERAIERLRGQPDMPALARGLTALALHDREGDPPLVARSFAQIYVLVLVFDAPFDELRAERAIQARIAVIERLVLALPPLDPTPNVGIRAVRRRR